MPTASEFIAKQKARPLPRRLPTKTKDIGGRGTQRWELEAETYRRQSHYPLKVHVIQRIRLAALEGEALRPDMGARVGDEEYRLAYYIVTAKDYWGWGQYCPMIPAEDFGPLLEQARAEGTLLH